MSIKNPSEFAAGCATYGHFADEVRELRAEVRQQTQRADWWRDRCDDVSQRLLAERLTVHRVRSLPRYTTEAGDQVVSAAQLDLALGVTR